MQALEEQRGGIRCRRCGGKKFRLEKAVLSRRRNTHMTKAERAKRTFSGGLQLRAGRLSGLRGRRWTEYRVKIASGFGGRMAEHAQCLQRSQ